MAVLDNEKQAGLEVSPMGSDTGKLPPIDREVEKRLRWKQDMILMPALGEYSSINNEGPADHVNSNGLPHPHSG